MHLLVVDMNYISDRVSKSEGKPWSNLLQILYPTACTNMLSYSDRQNESYFSLGSKGKGREGWER